MRAVWITGSGQPDGVEVRETNDPGRAELGEITVLVRAAGVNRADLLQARGLYPPPNGISPHIPGLEFSGEIVDKGNDVTHLNLGDRVFGISSGEAQAEMVKVPSGNVALLPENIDPVEAAAFPEAFVTAYDALQALGEMRSGQTVLIHAIGSGVGIVALQIAKHHGCRVIGTSRTQDKLDRCIPLGLDHPLVVEKPVNFAARTLDFTDGKGVDLIIDLVGASYFEENIRSMALKGRMIMIGLTGGTRAEIDMSVILRKRLSLIGTVLRSRTDAEKAAAVAAFAKNIVPHITNHIYHPVIDHIYDASDAAKAYRRVDKNENFGKVILRF